MPRSSLPRILLMSLLLLALAVPAARAAEPDRFSLAGLFDHAWGKLMSFWLMNGCGMDPSGRCQSEQKLDNGCGADPWGGCKDQQNLDNGCGIDPNGGCKPES